MLLYSLVISTSLSFTVLVLEKSSVKSGIEASSGFGTSSWRESTSDGGMSNDGDEVAVEAEDESDGEVRETSCDWSAGSFVVARSAAVDSGRNWNGVVFDSCWRVLAVRYAASMVNSEGFSIRSWKQKVVMSIYSSLSDAISLQGIDPSFGRQNSEMISKWLFPKRKRKNDTNPRRTRNILRVCYGRNRVSERRFWCQGREVIRWHS